MKSYRVLKVAERDLDGIFEYWAERASVGAAERVIDAITERFWILGEHPEAGYACKDIGRGVRCFPAGRYLVYYRRGRRGVDILHVFHGARVLIYKKSGSTTGDAGYGCLMTGYFGNTSRIA